MVPASLFAAAFERNHTPIMSDANRAGETFVTYESPIGERQSSPIVWKKYAEQSHIQLTRFPRSAPFAPITMNRNPVPSRNKPITIFIAVDGSKLRLPSDVQIHANMGEKIRMYAGFTD